MPIKNDRYLRALRRQPIDKTPVWIMRQAGRYLPEYRELRAQAGSFMNLCKNPELACEVTLQPLERFDLDAAILFSDILTIPDAMGLELSFAKGEGPQFAKTIQTQADITNLPQPDPETELRYVMDAVRTIKGALADKLPLIGFSGSPWTLACYMIEGQGSKTFSKAKRMLFAEPKMIHQLLEHLTISVTNYLAAQIEAGVDSIMLFDSWGGILHTKGYEHFSLAYMKKIIANLREKYDTPITLFTKGGGLWLDKIVDSGADCLGIDWQIQLKKAKEIAGKHVSLQGNLDPCVLYASEKEIHHYVSRILSHYGADSGHIFNLGHGIYPDVEPEKVAYLVELVHEISAHYHGG